jgi:ketosteroid isomerase-like protein
MRIQLLIIFLLLTVCAYAQHEQEVKEVIETDIVLNGLILKNDAQKAEAFYSNQFVLTTSSGTVKRKQDLVREIGSSDLQLEINSTADVSVSVEQNAALLTGVLHQKGNYKGKSFDVFHKVTDMWVRTSEGWKILAGHASILSKI